MRQVEYTIQIKEPHTHNVRVKGDFPVLEGEHQDLSMPTWIPGAYMIADFCKNVIRFEATDEKGKELPTTQVAKGTWRVRPGKAKRISARRMIRASTRPPK